MGFLLLRSDPTAAGGRLIGLAPSSRPARWNAEPCNVCVCEGGGGGGRFTASGSVARISAQGVAILDAALGINVWF